MATKEGVQCETLVTEYPKPERSTSWNAIQQLRRFGRVFAEGGEGRLLSKELGIGHCPTGSPGGNVDNSVAGMPYKKRRGLLGTALCLPSADGLQPVTKLIIHIRYNTPTNPATHDGLSA
jgi:hypothetical protein